MKYLVVVVLIVVGYFAYQKYAVTQERSTDGGFAEVIQRNGYILTKDILEKAHEAVLITCKDDLILKTWGSNAKECHERIKNFQSMCQERIFPELEVSVTDVNKSGKLFTRYVDCLLPREG